ncbi:MAG: hypothetical protein FWD21_04045, partial [Peptococcaceae bacterium]|nr:hypothetical protein [Peptococcaceae bacterium]
VVGASSITKILEDEDNVFIFYYALNTYNVTVTDSYAGAGNTGAGSYTQGTTVYINAGTRDGYTFTGWTVVSGTITLGSSSSDSTSFAMPASNVEVKANWQKDTPPPTFKVTVNDSNANPTGAGPYTPGTTVTIHAGAKEGYAFKGWTVTSGGVTLADSKSATTTFTMPSNDVVVTTDWTEYDPHTEDPEPTESWALLNLILCCIGALVAIFTVVYLFIRKNKNVNMLWLALAVIAGIAGVIIFFITENMSQKVTFVDWWTIVNAIILVLGAVGAAFTFKHKTNEKNANNTLAK